MPIDNELLELSLIFVAFILVLGWLFCVSYRDYSRRMTAAKCPDCGAWFYRSRRQRTCGGYQCGRLR